LADRYGAKITIMHVLEELSHNATMRLISVLGEDRWKEIQNRNIEDVLDTIKTRLNKFCDDMNAEFDQCEFKVENIIVRAGLPVENILSEANKSDYDLIVMGTHGHSALAGTMMGSTARRVVRRSLKPVLVIRLPEG
jgi:nucleotide-binding universal stress UspA family protein